MKRPVPAILFLMGLALLESGCGSKGTGSEEPRFIHPRTYVNKADIIRTVRTDTAVLPLYQGNGRFGCSFGPLGLHVHRDDLPGGHRFGPTQLMHIQHHLRAKNGGDYLLPLARITWKDKPERVRHYRQHQDLYGGTVMTQFETDHNEVAVTSWFDPVERDLMGWKIQLSGEPMDVLISPMEHLLIHYNQELDQQAVITQNGEDRILDLSCMNAATALHIRSNARIRITGENVLLLTLKEGENHLLISANSPVTVPAERSLQRTESWWNDTWKRTGSLRPDDPEKQKLWVRSVYQFLSTYNDDKLGIPPPCGFTGNGWPFNFPQDFSYIHPVLLATGHLEIAKAYVEYFADHIPGMKRYTKRLYGVGGICCPWVFPYGEFEGYHEPEPPNIFYYEIHNSGYLARMAHETAVMLNDPDWTERYALPLIRETAVFYRNICSKGEDGLWDIFVIPSMGQDENGGPNRKNYLDALYSARYCFRKMVEYGSDRRGWYREVLSDGLAFGRLLSEEGYYYSCEGVGKEEFGEQKHPVQLNSLAFLDVDSTVDPASRKAYENRYRITRDAREPFFYGWTLGEFLLAGSRLGTLDEWRYDWARIRAAHYTDPDWIQIYETSGRHDDSYYTTTNGLITQSLLDNVLSTWWGQLEVGRCTGPDDTVRFENIHLISGLVVDGKIESNHATLQLTARKPAEYQINGRKISLKEGETYPVDLKLD